MITTWAVTFSLILARAGMFVAILPFFGGNQVPRLVKVGLALALSVFWFSASAPPVDPALAKETEVGWFVFGIALGREAILGAVLGYAFGLFLVPAKVAGEFIAQEMGLSLGSIIDPSSGNSTSTLPQLFEMIALVIFFGMDGHHFFLAALQAAFVRWPIGGPIGQLPVTHLIGGAAAAEEAGILLAAPLALCLFLTAVVLALMARAAPQMNIFSIGFTMQIGVGLVVLVLFLPDLLAGMVRSFGRFADFVVRSV